jgi:hypothetical protein
LHYGEGFQGLEELFVGDGWRWRVSRCRHRVWQRKISYVASESARCGLAGIDRLAMGAGREPSLMLPFALGV